MGLQYFSIRRWASWRSVVRVAEHCRFDKRSLVVSSGGRSGSLGRSSGILAPQVARIVDHIRKALSNPEMRSALGGAKLYGGLLRQLLEAPHYVSLLDPETFRCLTAILTNLCLPNPRLDGARSVPTTLPASLSPLSLCLHATSLPPSLFPTFAFCISPSPPSGRGGNSRLA